MLKAGLRPHDKASMAIIELVDNGLPPLRPALVRAGQDLAAGVKAHGKSGKAQTAAPRL